MVYLNVFIEVCFSMIKRKFGNNVKCKKETSQDNEILAKVLVHNLCVLIGEMFLNKIDIDFYSCEGAILKDEKYKLLCKRHGYSFSVR